MPLYEYKCQRCGFTFEILQKPGDRPLQECSSCGGRLQKLLSSPAIQFKGSGWYVTDYARKDALSKPDVPQAGGQKKEAKAEPKAATPSED